MSTFPETRASLILQIKDPQNCIAWDEFAQIYCPIIYRIARAKGMQEADAQDLTQVVMLSVASAIERWEPRDDLPRFRNWLNRITRNAIIKSLTRGSRDELVGGGGELDEMFSERDLVDQSTINLIETEYRRQLYLRATEIVKKDVSAESWRVFEMTAINGIAIPEASRRLEKSVGSVYAIRSRVMQRLRESIRAIEDSEQ